MGGWLRFKERVKSKTPGPFKSTKAERIDKMYAEAKQFSLHVEKVEKKIRNLQVATAEMLNQAEVALTAPLPHVYAATERGDNTLPLPEGHTTVGGPASMTGYPSEVGSGYPTSNGGAQHMEGGFTPHSTSGLSSGSGLSTVPHLVNTADLKVIAQQSETKMNADVLTPINDWLRTWRSFSAQMGTLEKARLNFDGTRREFNKLELKRVRQQQAKDAVEPELASHLSAKQVSLDEKRSVFNQHESTVFDNLVALIMDARKLQGHIADALRIEEQTFKSSLV